MSKIAEFQYEPNMWSWLFFDTFNIIKETEKAVLVDFIYFENYIEITKKITKKNVWIPKCKLCTWNDIYYIEKNFLNFNIK